MLTESRIERLWDLIQMKRSLEAKIEKALAAKTRKATTKPNGHAATPKKASAKKISAKTRAAWKLQGQYIGSVRMLNKAQRKQVAKVRKEEGYKKAIAKAKELQS